MRVVLLFFLEGGGRFSHKNMLANFFTVVGVLVKQCNKKKCSVDECVQWITVGSIPTTENHVP